MLGICRFDEAMSDHQVLIVCQLCAFNQLNLAVTFDASFNEYVVNMLYVRYSFCWNEADISIISFSDGVKWSLDDHQSDLPDQNMLYVRYSLA